MSDEKFKDDGRTIVSMNIEGMPWHLGGPKVPEYGKKSGDDTLERLELTRGEKWAITKAVMLTVLPIGFVFVAAYFLFFLFAHFVWLA